MALLQSLKRFFRGRSEQIRAGGVSDLMSQPERFWTAAFAHGGITTWMSEGACREYINECVTGSPHEWPMEWFARAYAQRPFERGLSLGCGEGALERDVRRKGICRHIVGMDLSQGALSSATRQAAEEGLDGIEYVRGDFNDLDLPAGRFDIVFFHQAMHHVENLEKCTESMRRALKPGGWLYLDEYVGPSRHEWTHNLLVDANRALHRVPPKARRGKRLELPIAHDDPSEAIRSSEILPVVTRFFEVAERRDYGGNILSLVHPWVDWSQLDEAERAELLQALIQDERQLLAGGQGSFYSVIVARPTAVSA